MLDDIQWADELSLRLLACVGRHMAEGDRVLIVATARLQPGAPRTALATALRGLRACDRLTELSLQPLDRQATFELARALDWPSADAAGRACALDELGERLWRLSEGNPFVITEAVRNMARGQADPDLALPMPARVRDMVMGHLGQLAPEDRALVSLCAVLGRELEFALVESLWRARRRPAAEVSDGIERLVRAGIFAGTGDRCDFVHDRIREVAYDALPEPSRRALHRQVATALDDGGCQPGAAAYHFARAGAPQAASDCLLRQAEDAARRFGLAEALTALDQAAALVASVDPHHQADLRVRIATRRAGYLGYAGRLQEVEACLLAERSELEHLTDMRLRAIYFAALGYTHSLAGHSGAAAEAGEQSLAAALGAEDRRTERRARSLLAYEAAHSGRFARGIELGQAAVAIGLAPETDPEHAVLACCSLALNQLHAGDCQAALASLELGRARSEASGLTRERAFVLAFTATAHAAMGDHDLAARANRQAIALASDVMSRTLAGTQHLVVHVAAGGGATDFRAAHGSLAGHIDGVARAGNLHGLGLAHLYAARAHLQDGARALASEHGSRARQLLEEAGDPRAAALAAVAQGLALGPDRDGHEPVAHALETLQALGARLDWADAQLSMARLVGSVEAKQHRQAAVARYEQLGLPKRAAQAHTLGF